MEKEDKVIMEELMEVLRDKLSQEEFHETISGLLEMGEEEFEELLKMADILEETTNQ